MQTRQKQNESRKKQPEERLDRTNDAGYFDLTAYSAIASLREKDKRRDKSIKVRPLK